MPLRNLGPDAARYCLAGLGQPVPRPFHLRWLLPKVLADDLRAWRVVWLLSWPVLFGAMFGWRFAAGDAWPVALASASLLVALPGILGPSVSIPVQVDLPSTALTMVGVWWITAGHPAQIAAGVAVVAVAACISEKAPVVAALTSWTLWPLIALVPVVVAFWLRESGPDPLGPKFQDIADHPIRSALEHHAGRWRDGWLMVAPWGVCLAGLVGADWQVVVVLAVAYAQLLVATDTVRLVHHVAGPVMAAAAASVVPVEWLLFAVVLHVVWFRVPERV